MEAYSHSPRAQAVPDNGTDTWGSSSIVDTPMFTLVILSPLYNRFSNEQGYSVWKFISPNSLT